MSKRKTAATLFTVLFSLGYVNAIAVPPEDQMFRSLSQPLKYNPSNVTTNYHVDEIIVNHRLRLAAPGVEINSIDFRSGSSFIPASEHNKIQSIANVIHRFVRENPKERFLLEGHTDAVGTNFANRELSQSRADAVTALLVHEFLVPQFAISSIGMGSTSLLVNSRGPEPRNRRVTLRRITDLVNPPGLVTSRRRTIWEESDDYREGTGTSQQQEAQDVENIPLPNAKPKIPPVFPSDGAVIVDL